MKVLAKREKKDFGILFWKLHLEVKKHSLFIYPSGKA